MKLLLALLLLFSAPVMALDACYAGAWNDPARVGEGIAFEVNPDTAEINGFFYTYNAEVPHWYVLLGDETEIVMYAGQKLAEEPFNAYVEPMGIARILGVSNDTLIFTYVLALKPNGNKCKPDKDDVCAGEFIYNRITQMIPCADPK
jgi:hypothetical protein